MIDNGGITFMMPNKAPKFCPHCGAKAEFKAALICDTPSAIIKCTKCSAQSYPVSIGHYMYYKGQPDVTLTIEQATEEARAAWDARVAGPPDQLERYLLSNFRALSEDQKHEYLNSLKEPRSPKLHIISDTHDDDEGDGVDG